MWSLLWGHHGDPMAECKIRLQIWLAINFILIGHLYNCIMLQATLVSKITDHIGFELITISMCISSPFLAINHRYKFWAFYSYLLVMNVQGRDWRRKGIERLLRYIAWMMFSVWAYHKWEFFVVSHKTTKFNLTNYFLQWILFHCK